MEPVEALHVYTGGVYRELAPVQEHAKPCNILGEETLPLALALPVNVVDHQRRTHPLELVERAEIHSSHASLSLALFLSVKTKRTHVHSTTFCVFPSKRLLNSCTISSTTVCSLSTVLSSPCMCQHFLAVHPPFVFGRSKNNNRGEQSRTLVLDCSSSSRLLMYIYICICSFVHTRSSSSFGFFLYTRASLFLFLSFCSCLFVRVTVQRRTRFFYSLSLSHTHTETFTHSHVRTRSVLFLLFTVRDAHTAAPALCLVSRSIGGVLFSSSARARFFSLRLLHSLEHKRTKDALPVGAYDFLLSCSLPARFLPTPPFPPPPPPPPSKTLTPLSSSPHSTPSFPLSQFPKRTDPTRRNSFTTFSSSSSSSSSLEYEWRASARASLLHSTDAEERLCRRHPKSTLKKREEPYPLKIQHQSQCLTIRQLRVKGRGSWWGLVGLFLSEVDEEEHEAAIRWRRWRRRRRSIAAREAEERRRRRRKKRNDDEGDGKKGK